jgi:DNA-binding CsgD family transcriptional regulator
LDQGQILELVTSYASGTTVPQLASEYQIHRTTVMRHLEQQGIPRRPNVRKLSDAQVEEAGRMYVSGLSTANVGKHFGVNAETVRTHLRRAGVQIRPRRG